MLDFLLEGFVLTPLSVLMLIGGIGMFLYGMNLLGEALQNMAGAGLEKILKRLTNNKIKGATVGTVVTGIIQSSAATTIMVLGFLNASIMNLAQGIPVIMGANIGSTVTGQILRLGDISSDNVFLTLIKPEAFAPVIVGVGAFILLFAKKKKTRNIAKIMLGFGILFMGMTIMEKTITPLKDNETFQNMFLTFSNPFIGILFGMVFTAIIQSSSASVGILQAISSTGAVTFSMALPIIVGQNIGKCFTVLLASIGTNKNAKRATLIDVMFNVLGGVLFVSVLYSAQYSIGLPFWNDIMSRGDIADIHTSFNVITTLILLPLSSSLIKISGKVVKDKNPSKINQELGVLDDIFLKTPPVALQQSRTVILNMAETAKENFKMSTELLMNYDSKIEKNLQENERFLDKAETALNEYLVKITGCSLNEQETLIATELMHNVGDFERIGDYCINIADVAEYNSSNNITFSGEGKKEIKAMVSAVGSIIDITIDAIANNSLETSHKVEPLEEVIDSLKETLTAKHVTRLQKGICNVEAGISFVELITNLERISDHCSNIAVHLIQRLTEGHNFDTHEHLRRMHKGDTEEYREMYAYYEDIYYNAIK